jgi:hypothetical protein
LNPNNLTLDDLLGYKSLIPSDPKLLQRAKWIGAFDFSKPKGVINRQSADLALELAQKLDMPVIAQERIYDLLKPENNVLFEVQPPADCKWFSTKIVAQQMLLKAALNDLGREMILIAQVNHVRALFFLQSLGLTVYVPEGLSD